MNIDKVIINQMLILGHVPTNTCKSIAMFSRYAKYLNLGFKKLDFNTLSTVVPQLLLNCP